MDIVTDLSSRAVSYLSVYQDICKMLKIESSLADKVFKSSIEKFEELKITSVDQDTRTAINKLLNELMWKCEPINASLLSVFIKNIEVLRAMLESASKVTQHETESVEQIKSDLYNSPFYWRKCFRYVLYDDKQKRLLMAQTLEYLPLLVVLALGKKKEVAYDRRLYQVYGNGKKRLDTSNTRRFKFIQFWQKLLSEQTKYNDWWEADFLPKKKRGKYFSDHPAVPKENKRSAHVERLLQNDQELLDLLLIKEIPLPFETLYNQELDEIDELRKLRKRENIADKLLPNYGPASTANDPLLRASSMKLAGLALSGGGIRSATFNLGVIQKLAELGALRRFDYISTVSGGGYIGSWLVSWIKRARSIGKVNNRLNPKISADPMSEEVRPIRWLRMYSNYLAPSKGAMSGDSWTFGMTLVRNAIINQLVLFLMLCCALCVISLTHFEWRQLANKLLGVTTEPVLAYSSILLLIGAIITGLAMRVFDRDSTRPSRFKFGSSRWLPIVLIGWAILISFIGSAWMFKNINDCTVREYFHIVRPIAVAAFGAMLVIATFGRYHARCKTAKERLILRLWVIFSSALAAVIGAIVLALVWKLLEEVRKYNGKYVFIIGLPLILETISICVITRMAIMGRLFPDERREWWGRIGGLIHRLILIWLLVATCSLGYSDLISFVINNIEIKRFLPLAVASWGALIATAVKLAFQAASQEKQKNKGSINYIDIFLRFAPYLFMIGFVLLGSYAYEKVSELLKQNPDAKENKIWVVLVLFSGTFLLSLRVGVNEFSLHHFYRNRLTRAYLGATRRRTARENTANKFTGFDNLDDLKLCDLTSKDEYMGPYPIVNTCLNASTVSALDRQDRKAESFILSPLYCGFDFSTNRSAADTQNGIFQYGYRPTAHYAETGGLSLGTAMAMSGAAVNPNMGYHSSAPTAFMLTVFNVRLGRWIGNPRLDKWQNSDPGLGMGYLIKDLVGKSDIDNDYVCISDGGHFDNMGIYELVRRKCSYILLCDAEEDPEASCEGLANAIRRCRIDFGVEIKIDTSKITEKDKETSYSKEHLVVGSICYPGDDKPSGKLVYVKTTLTGTESVDIRQYYMNNDSFPQESTGDQYFDESQFESYRKLGYDSINNLGELNKKV